VTENPSSDLHIGGSVIETELLPAHKVGSRVVMYGRNVETYGGKIWAENRSEGGAAFLFTIPLSAEGPAQTA
jgi:hypothetical protein